MLPVGSVIITSNTTHISTNIPVSIHFQTGFLLCGGEKNHVFCVSLQSQRSGGRAMGDAAGGLPVMCGDGKAYRDVEYSRKLNN